MRQPLIYQAKEGEWQSVEEKIEGYVSHIKFRNEENGYTVLYLEAEEFDEVLVGNFPYITEGEYICATGMYTEHPVHGPQFQVSSYETKIPTDHRGMERYLASGAIKGIGKELAKRIIKKFKRDAFRIIEEEPERLAEIKGISSRKAMDIAEQFQEKQDMRQAMMFLSEYGITANYAMKIYQEYGPDLYRIVKENPYQMAEDISGIGFKTADEIARRVGVDRESDFRICSGILYMLMQGVAAGHVYLPKEMLVRKTAELLGINPDYIEDHFMSLVLDKKIVMKTDGEEEQIYSEFYYFMELSTANMLCERNIEEEIEEEELEREIGQIEEQEEIELDELQRQAIKMAAKYGVLIITGGPGTGKTTTINTLIRYFEEQNMEIMLAAPTGRAAKRMKEATGYEASTIHRLLELNGDVESKARLQFQKNEENPLETDVLIVDEMSMVDIHLMYSLLKATVCGTRLIFVGDANQLPSVGPGNVLQDMIASEVFPVVKLTKIFRQKERSDIVLNAHKINAGERISLDNKSKDFFFLHRENPRDITGVMVYLVRDKLPNYVDASSFDIQVLTPMRKGELGVERLNVVLQHYLNPEDSGKAEKEVHSGIFREGDKVMQIKNNYNLEWQIKNKRGYVLEEGCGVFNGDMGRIKEISSFSEKVVVEFEEGKLVEYPFNLLDELELAYAITVHKSQGSEYPAVVMPILGGPRVLMNRNLIYTAVTRAKQCVTIVGTEYMVNSMIQNATEQKRYTNLDVRIREMYEILYKKDR